MVPLATHLGSITHLARLLKKKKKKEKRKKRAFTLFFYYNFILKTEPSQSVLSRFCRAWYSRVTLKCIVP